MPVSLPPAMIAAFEQCGATLAAWSAAHPDAPLAEAEAAVLDAVRTLLPRLLAPVLASSVRDLDPALRWVRRRCPTCGHRTAVHAPRLRQVQTRCGVVTLERPWYHCRACHHGFSPADAVLGLAPHARLSAGLHTWLVQLGTQATFREAAQLLSTLTGLVVDAETVRQHTEQAGATLVAAAQAASAQVVATGEAADPRDPAPGTLVLQTDGLMVPFLDGWHEVKLARVSGTDAHGALVASSFVAARASAADFGPLVLAEAARRGALTVIDWQGGVTTPALARLRPVHVLGDGAPWIWSLAADHFGERTEVVDFWHATEHLATVAHACWGEGTPAATAWWEAQRGRLWAQGGGAVWAVLTALAAQPPTTAAAPVLRRACGYFGGHRARMAYPAIRARGLPIGSGAVESACRHVIQHRLKRSGQRWSVAGAQALCALRARAASGRPLTLAAGEPQ